MGFSKKPPHSLGSRPALAGRNAPQLGHAPVHAFEGVNVPKVQPDLDANKGHDTSAMSLYLNDIGRYSLITVEEEVTLAARIKLGDEAAREKMIRSNLRLVVRIAQDYANFGLPILDLIAEGNLGLMKAVERFDPTKGGKLSTYAAWWIKQHMKRALSTQIKTIRLPIHLVERLAKIRKTAALLEQAFEREPTDEEIGVELGLPAHKVTHLKTMAHNPASLEAPVMAGMEDPLGAIVADEAATTPAQDFSSKSTAADLLGLLDKLTTRQAQVIRMRFGFGQEKGMTLEEIGNILGITRERVRQLQDEALEKLRVQFVAGEGSRTRAEAHAFRKESFQLEALQAFMQERSKS